MAYFAVTSFGSGAQGRQPGTGTSAIAMKLRARKNRTMSFFKVILLWFGTALKWNAVQQ